ncbi:MAG TPA: hypothetical protein VFV87_02295 [Pirellulaceae bacterium]|nr:hypothetical protein [Pirellulaceae bacterium]
MQTGPAKIAIRRAASRKFRQIIAKNHNTSQPSTGDGLSRYWANGSSEPLSDDPFAHAPRAPEIHACLTNGPSQRAPNDQNIHAL